MRRRLTGALVAGALAVTGCSATPPPLPFEEGSAVADELPGAISEDARDSVEASTVRYQGSTDAVEVWAAREEVERREEQRKRCREVHARMRAKYGLEGGQRSLHRMMMRDG